MQINSLKGAVNLVKKLQKKAPEMTAKNGEKLTKLCEELLTTLKAELLAIFD